MALWGGRFEGRPDGLFEALNNSLRFDYRLAKEDIRCSIAWAKAIALAGVLTKDELGSLVGALEVLGRRVAENPSLPTHSQDEDIHSWVEARLVEGLGPPGKKLHTGRSRNDQVATDLRLWVRGQVDARLGEIREAQKSLVRIADRERSAIMPGYTHLQRAQPVLFAHWALAYVEMLERDGARFVDARTRVNVCPLGSGALAGTAYAIDRASLAKDLGFDCPTANSLDAVSDRDFVVETLAACSLCAVHLSRLGEDLVVYGSQEFGLVEFSDDVSSGSSLMPQKKNPDAAELLRGKSGRIVGQLVSMLTTLKGLPLSYNKDLQEDKEPLFEAMDHLSLSLRIVPVMMDGLKVRRDTCRRAAQGGYSNATDLADYLVGKGVAFRDAHDRVGRIVRRAIELGKPLEELPLAEMKNFAPACGEDVFPVLALEAGLMRREVQGGAGPGSVAAALDHAKARLGM